MLKLRSGGAVVLASSLLVLAAAAASAQDRTDVPDFASLQVSADEHDTTACPGPTCVISKIYYLFNSWAYGSGHLGALVQRQVMPATSSGAGVMGFLYEPDKVKRDSKPQLQLKQSAQVAIGVMFMTSGMSPVIVMPVPVEGCTALVKVKDDNTNKTFESPGDKFKWKFKCPQDVLTAASPNGLGLTPAQAQAFEKAWGSQKVDFTGKNP